MRCETALSAVLWYCTCTTSTSTSYMCDKRENHIGAGGLQLQYQLRGVLRNHGNRAVVAIALAVPLRRPICMYTTR